MNSFEAKYMKIASKYLDEKLKLLNVKPKNVYKLDDKKESTIQRIVSGIFNS